MLEILSVPIVMKIKKTNPHKTPNFNKISRPIALKCFGFSL